MGSPIRVRRRDVLAELEEARAVQGHGTAAKSQAVTMDTVAVPVGTVRVLAPNGLCAIV